jgi:hypothetical protein
MTKTVEATISDELLTSGTDHSDRFVYSNYFVPLLVTFKDDRTPILPFYVKEHIVELVRQGVIDGDHLVKLLGQLGLSGLWELNEMNRARERLDGAPYVSAPQGARVRRFDLQRITRDLDETDKLLEVFASGRDESSDELLTIASKRLARSVEELLAGNGEVLDGLPSPQSANGGAGVKTRATVLPEQDAELIAGLLQSTVGYVFLDRTRIRPVGFAIGEPVYALGLAPGEEVVLEQKTFTKREATFEDQTEQEKQFDIELSSTYSTELQEGYERHNSLTGGWGHHADHTGQYSSPIGLPWGQINAQHTLGSTLNSTTASDESARRSVKDGQTASSKVSAKYRTQHKTTFKVTTESGFEASSKRTIRNPNRATPVTLHYFKIMQRLQMHQQRYGVRLCWSPSIENPARTFFAKIQAGRAEIIAHAGADLPPAPKEPPRRGPSGESTTTERLFETSVSPVFDTYLWNVGGGQTADYDIDIPVPTGYTWDGVKADSNITVFTTRPAVNRWIVGMPYVTDTPTGKKLRVRVHIDCGNIVGGDGIQVQVKSLFYKDVILTQTLVEDTTYADDIAAYRVALKDWTDARDAALLAAEEAADALEQRLLASLSPINEMISQIVEQNFPPAVRDEVWEIDYWQRLFDWDRASFVAYPSWWSSGDALHAGGTRDPSRDPSDFINASWAKLYLPVRVGMEQLALRWIFGKAVAVPLASEVEARFTAIVDDLRAYRNDVLGAPDEIVALDTPCKPVPEKFACLASWAELMPTDGTHIEVVQAATSAADLATKQEIDDAAALRSALVESEQRSAGLKDKAAQQMTEPATINVRVGADGTG